MKNMAPTYIEDGVEYHGEPPRESPDLYIPGEPPRTSPELYMPGCGTTGVMTYDFDRVTSEGEGRRDSECSTGSSVQEMVNLTQALHIAVPPQGGIPQHVIYGFPLAMTPPQMGMTPPPQMAQMGMTPPQMAMGMTPPQSHLIPVTCTMTPPHTQIQMAMTPPQGAQLQMSAMTPPQGAQLQMSAMTPPQLQMSPYPPTSAQMVPVSAAPALVSREMAVATPPVQYQTYPMPESKYSEPSVTTRMDIVWHGEFDKNMAEFSPEQWELHCIDVVPQNGTFQTYKDSAKVRFCCHQCGKGWTSMKGRVVFFFKRMEAEKSQVLFKLYGQQCTTCKNGDFEHAMWYPEEVIKVIGNLYNKIGMVYYNFERPPVRVDRRVGKPRNPHNSDLCQACKEGICREDYMYQ